MTNGHCKALIDTRDHHAWRSGNQHNSSNYQAVALKRIDLQPAYILHTRPYRDTSALVDLLSLDYGLLRAVARGVRGGSSRKRTVMQPFQPLLVSLAGRGELLNLNQVEHAAPGFRLAGDHLFSAMYLNELLMRLLHAQEAHPAIYRVYQQALVSLQQRGSLEACLRRFEFRLLQELGYAWDLSVDAVSGETLQADQCYLFNPEHGYESVQAPAGQWPPALFRGDELRRFAADMATGDDNTPAAASGNGDADTECADHGRSAAKRLMRQALQPHLGSKPLLSRRLFAARSISDRLPEQGRTGVILPPENNKG
ncbi:DNA repair protein RecO [Pseudohongiella sp.]|uniref:DNA repair protein RecO n=1 Tax=marine sediment metagenome TaxID=412755 RepID=A0A0F9Z0L6_9ZZZZ|nr:DNA repair protein RecO [Pseudohongiella sp.]HDZ09856.1 DNA repair protein RecO [Pseudohongiella sp.]HEA61529.1 DNA repair protein RecO [Pseudohongiella sp.]